MSRSIYVVLYFLFCYLFFTGCTSTSKPRYSYRSTGLCKYNNFKKQYKYYVFSRKKYKTTLFSSSYEYDQLNVDYWLYYFSTCSPNSIPTYAKKAEKYRVIVEKIFKEYGIPLDIFYLGIVESAYNVKAVSTANAVGPWQFLSSTGRYYGLKISDGLDERTNLYKSTYAAAKFLKDLYQNLGSWELAVAGYNSGQPRIMKAIKRGKSRSYRVLSQKKLLPHETRQYIPKLLAIKKLYIDYLRNHTPVHPSQKWTRLPKSILIKRSTNLNTLISQLKINKKLFYEHNSDLNSSFLKIPPRRAIKIYLPGTKKTPKQIRSALKTSVFQKSKRKNTKQKCKDIKNVNNRPLFRYTVNRYDTLQKVASRYEICPSSIARINKLNKKRVYEKQILWIPDSRKIFHTVKKGEILSKISAKYNVKIQAIIKSNNLKNHQIRKGQRLIIPSQI